MTRQTQPRAKRSALASASTLTESQLRSIMFPRGKREQVLPSPAQKLRGKWKRLCHALNQYIKPVLKRRQDRKLELLEVQQLGEKRFLAIVRVNKQQFLVGGGASSVLLLAELGTDVNSVISPRPFNQESA